MMCEQCALAVEWHYPHLTDEERGEILRSYARKPTGRCMVRWCSPTLNLIGRWQNSG